jgi:hypothetical protein
LRAAPLSIPYVRAGAVKLPCPAVDHMQALYARGIPMGEAGVDLDLELNDDRVNDVVFILLDLESALEASAIYDEEDAERRWIEARLAFDETHDRIDCDLARSAICRMHEQIVAAQTEAIQSSMPTDKKDDGPGNGHGPHLMPGMRHESRAQRWGAFRDGRSAAASRTRRGCNSFTQISFGRGRKPAGNQNGWSRMSGRRPGVKPPSKRERITTI